mgnify:CR=1 FL=1
MVQESSLSLNERIAEALRVGGEMPHPMYGLSKLLKDIQSELARLSTAERERDEARGQGMQEVNPKGRRKVIPVTAVWLRRIGDHAQLLVEVRGKWKIAIREHIDGNFSHIAEALGEEKWIADEDDDG